MTIGTLTDAEFEQLKNSRKACKMSESGKTVEVYAGNMLVEIWRAGKRVYHEFEGVV